MRSILSKSVMVIATIAIAVSLAVALAPDASAQDSRPTIKDVEATTPANSIGFIPKVCCITVMTSATISTTEINSESAGCETPHCCPSRWFCADYYTNGNNHPPK